MPEKPSSPFKIQIDYFKRPHPFRRLKIQLSIAAAAIAGFWLLVQSLVGYRELYSPAKLASPHSFIENDCVRCHTGSKGAWVSRSVTSSACTVCHAGPIHHTNQLYAGQAGAQPDCATCHEEHRGQTFRPSLVRDAKCTQCHAALPQSTAGTPPPAGYVARIMSFASVHPEFKVIRDHQKDTAQIKLNHKKHLRPDLPGADGRPVQMKCADCHQTDKGGTGIKPIEFERDCQSCHRLEFFELVPEPAPHEEPIYVEAFVRTALAKYAGRNPNEWKKDVDWHPARNIAELRRMVDEAPRNLPQWLERKIVDSNRLLFEKKCRECHVVQNATARIPTVVKTGIPNVWFPHSRFAHEPHRMLQCESCHKNVAESSETADVLLPSRSDCLTCHAPSRAPDRCAVCHIYHQKQ